MRAAVYEQFQEAVEVREVDDPTPSDGGAVLLVKATGVCRSDWHGWMGHDPDIRLPHVPGHELAGVVEEVGKATTKWRRGDRVTLPFVCGCGRCEQCRSGNHQVCDRQFQPGFTHWGSYAEYVAVDFADVNLVALPDDIDFASAASLGCRFSTSFRAIVAQGRVRAGQWVAIHGCGGVGLSAVMIAVALGAKVVAIDINADALRLAQAIGASSAIDARAVVNVPEAVKDLTGGGAHVSVDALGSRATCCDSIACLRKRGRHVQVGLLAGQDHRPALPMELVVANELEIVGSHGMAAHHYARMLDMIKHGKLEPSRLIGRTIDLQLAAANLQDPEAFGEAGVTVITRF